MQLCAFYLHSVPMQVPTSELVTRYEQRYQTYRKIYPALHSLN